MNEHPMTRRNDDMHWAIDRKVPVALIVTMLVAFLGQWGAAAYWVASTNTRLEVVEHQSLLIGPQAERIIRLETKVDAITQSLQEIKGLIRAPANERR